MAQLKWSVVCRAVGQLEHWTVVVFFPNLLCFTGSWVPSEVQALFMLNIIVYQASIRLLIRAVFLYCRIQQSPNPGLPCTSFSLLNIVYKECHYNVYSVYVF